MKWVDVAGAPGSGKSTLFDGTWQRKIPTDDKPYPATWHAFIECAYRLVRCIDKDKLPQESWFIFDQYARKAATLMRKEEPGVYMNTAMAQAGLDIGWRFGGDIRGYFGLMPVSVGVVFLTADIDTLRKRNVEKGRDRSFQIEGMERTREIATLELKKRGVSVLTLDTRSPIEENRKNVAAWIG